VIDIISSVKHREATTCFCHLLVGVYCLGFAKRGWFNGKVHNYC